MMRLGLLAAVVCGCQYHAPTAIADDASTPDTSIDAPIDAPPIDSPPPEFWTGVVGATASTNNLIKTTGVSNWGDAGASSVATVASGNCYVEFTTAEFNKGKALGLSHGDSTQSFNDIDFDLMLGANGKMFVYEGAVQIGTFGSYAPGDLFRVEVIGSAINYYRNGLLFLTRVRTPIYPLLVDAALFSADATLQNVTFVDL